MGMLFAEMEKQLGTGHPWGQEIHVLDVTGPDWGMCMGPSFPGRVERGGTILPPHQTMFYFGALDYETNFSY